MAVQTLETARSAIESAFGTFVTPTRLLYFSPGGATWTQTVASIAPVESRGSYFQHFRQYAGLERNSFQFQSDATFDDLALYGSTHIKGGVTATGASADKTWVFTPSAATDDLKSLSLEYGTVDSVADGVAWKIAGLKGSKLTYGWVQGEEAKVTVEYMAKGAATSITAFDASLSDRTNVSALGTTTKVYIDDGGGTIGTTEDDNVLSASWALDNGLQYLDTLNGTATAQDILRPNPRTFKLSVVRYFADVTEWTAFTTKAERMIRIATTGPTLGGSNYSIQLDCYGYWDTHSISRSNGILVANMDLVDLYDSSAATDFTLTVVNSLASIS